MRSLVGGLFSAETPGAGDDLANIESAGVVQVTPESRRHGKAPFAG